MITIEFEYSAIVFQNKIITQPGNKSLNQGISCPGCCKHFLLTMFCMS